MRILQVYSFFSLPHGGGAVERVYKISRALLQRGHEVTLYTSDFDLQPEYINSLTGLKTRIFHSVIDLPGLHITPGLISESAKNLKNFDIIHISMAFRLLSIPMVLLQKSIKKYLSSVMIYFSAIVSREIATNLLLTAKWESENIKN
jgi:glycosyltransferase involved in cell wall biosynthesis